MNDQCLPSIVYDKCASIRYLHWTPENRPPQNVLDLISVAVFLVFLDCLANNLQHCNFYSAPNLSTLLVPTPEPPLAPRNRISSVPCRMGAIQQPDEPARSLLGLPGRRRPTIQLLASAPPEHVPVARPTGSALVERKRILQIYAAHSIHQRTEHPLFARVSPIENTF